MSNGYRWKLFRESLCTAKSQSLQKQVQPSRTNGWRDAWGWREGMIERLLQTKASLLRYQPSHNNQRVCETRRGTLCFPSPPSRTLQTSGRSEKVTVIKWRTWKPLRRRRSSRSDCSFISIKLTNLLSGPRAEKRQRGVRVIGSDSRSGRGCTSRTSGLQTPDTWNGLYKTVGLSGHLTSTLDSSTPSLILLHPSRGTCASSSRVPPHEVFGPSVRRAQPCENPKASRHAPASAGLWEQQPPNLLINTQNSVLHILYLHH